MRIATNISRAKSPKHAESIRSRVLGQLSFCMKRRSAYRKRVPANMKMEFGLASTANSISQGDSAAIHTAHIAAFLPQSIREILPTKTIVPRAHNRLYSLMPQGSPVSRYPRRANWVCTSSRVCMPNRKLPKAENPYSSNSSPNRSFVSTIE